MAMRKYPTVGCCGIDCGLCPRHYTDGASRCPGCGGEGFELKHPPCGFITCCVKTHGAEVCAQCDSFPCSRFERETGEHDSFVLHRRVMPNQWRIRDIGLDAFLNEQASRIAFLEEALREHDDGRSKGYFCMAATLLTLAGLRQALTDAANGLPLKTELARVADLEGQELKLRK